jgi:hypothetical protein
MSLSTRQGIPDVGYRVTVGTVVAWVIGVAEDEAGVAVDEFRDQGDNVEK